MNPIEDLSSILKSVTFSLIEVIIGTWNEREIDLGDFPLSPIACKFNGIKIHLLY
jgi:hypothetical protein